MQFYIESDGNLYIHADAQDRRILAATYRVEPRWFGTDEHMCATLSGMAQYGFSWCTPEEVDALTSAPLICKRNDNGIPQIVYGFMDYALRSPQQDLLETGVAVFTKG